LILFSLQILGVPDDPVALKEMEELWFGIVPQKCALVCFKENSPEIVGLNMVSVYTKDDKEGKPDVK
jgi:hypothetical protein